MEPELIAAKFADLEAREENTSKRLDRLEEIVENIRDLTASVQMLASKQDDMCKSIEKMDGRLGTIESEPGKKWKKIVDQALSMLVAALIGFVIAKIGM